MVEITGFKPPVLAAIIAVRTGSARLPNKCLMNLGGRTVLENIVIRTQMVVEDVIVATTTLPEDDIIPIIVGSMERVSVFRGDPENVYCRVRAAAIAYGVDYIVRITADCPLVDPDIIAKTVVPVLFGREYAASRLNPDAYPDGLDVEVFGLSSMTTANVPDRAEDITQGIKANCADPYALPLTHYGPLGNRRWTLDTPADLKFIQDVYDRFGIKFTWEDVLRWEDGR